MILLSHISTLIGESYMDGQDQQVNAWLLLQSLPKPGSRSMDSGFRRNDAAGAPS